jgi:hypothetical protein
MRWTLNVEQPVVLRQIARQMMLTDPCRLVPRWPVEQNNVTSSELLADGYLATSHSRSPQPNPLPAEEEAALGEYRTS